MLFFSMHFRQAMVWWREKAHTHHTHMYFYTYTQTYTFTHIGTYTYVQVYTHRQCKIRLKSRFVQPGIDKMITSQLASGRVAYITQRSPAVQGSQSSQGWCLSITWIWLHLSSSASCSSMVLYLGLALRGKSWHKVIYELNEPLPFLLLFRKCLLSSYLACYCVGAGQPRCIAHISLSSGSGSAGTLFSLLGPVERTWHEQLSEPLPLLLYIPGSVALAFMISQQGGAMVKGVVPVSCSWFLFTCLFC